MSKARLEAFSDGVIAILITIMVLELRLPSGSDWQALRPLAPVFAIYALSFAFLGIYWVNHHHLVHMTTRITGGILWANLHLLFWLSLVPFVTGWMGEHLDAPVPTAAYGIVFVAAAIAYTLLTVAIMRAQGPDSRLRAAIGGDLKGKLSTALYLAAIPLAFTHHLVSQGIYVFVALFWLVPDRRLERHLRE
jgi:uncharacterized membrane protein